MVMFKMKSDKDYTCSAKEVTLHSKADWPLFRDLLAGIEWWQLEKDSYNVDKLNDEVTKSINWAYSQCVPTNII